VNDVPVPTGAPDMSSYVAAATANGVDGIVVALAGQDALNFVIAARQTDPKLKMALISTDVVKVTKTLGKSAEGIIESDSFFNAKQAPAANKAYDAAMKAAGFKKGSSELSYAAVQVLAAVAKDLPDITAAAVYDKLPTVSNLSIGLLPPLQFQTGGVGGIPRVYNGCEQATQIKKKKEVPLLPMQNPFTGQTCPTS
jgi:ABC-type branched-subunit amino acid transport system substrate-binding protein